VIQGSVLGPLLFLLYVNDVTDVFGNKCRPTCKLYDDNIKLYSIVDQCELRYMLQQWSDMWQLSYFIQKCNVLYLDNRKNKPNVSTVLGGENIPQVSQVNNLWVIIDSELKFDKHSNQIVSRAQQVANLIHKCFVSKDKIY